MKHYQCPLGKLFPDTPDIEKIKRDGWIEQGILVIDVEDRRLSEMDKALVTNIGEHIYGVP